MSSNRSQRGRLIVVAAPSGAGKTTLVHALLRREPNLRFSVSYTTRPKRPSEVDGKDYFFVSEERFATMVRERAFLECARVFDHCYGTGRAHVESLLAAGDSVLLEIDWQGARQVRASAPDALSVFILPPSVPALEARLRGRASDAPDVIERRLRDAVGDMSHWEEFSYVLVNEDLDTAADELAGIVRGDGTDHRSDSPEVRERVARIFATVEAEGG
jgi:guanylate kinase